MLIQYLATSQKVPTILSRGVPTKWGYQVRGGADTIQGFKLLLDKSEEIRYLPAVDCQTFMEKMKSTPVQVSGDYLKFLLAHVKDLLGRRFGSAWPAMQLDCVLTVPAVWSDRARDATLQAASLAGISRSNLTLISESEAAAAYTMRTMQPNSLAVRPLLLDGKTCR